MKLLGSTKTKTTKERNSKNVPHLEITEVVLLHCNIVNNDYQQYSRLLYIFVPNETVGSLSEISQKNHIFSKTFNSKFQETEVWFTDQNSQPLLTKDKINLTLIIK